MGDPKVQARFRCAAMIAASLVAGCASIDLPSPPLGPRPDLLTAPELRALADTQTPAAPTDLGRDLRARAAALRAK